MPLTPNTPFLDGLTMPPRYAPHERTYISWPPEVSYRWSVKEARNEHAFLAKAIAPFEEVTILARSQDAASVLEYLEIGGNIELLEIPLDDAWIRDSGPIFVTDGNRGVAMVNFEFNGWGGRYDYENCNASPIRISEWLGIRRYDAPFILEGGGFSVDGEGTLITTEQFLLNPNRNAMMSREEIESGLHAFRQRRAIRRSGASAAADDAGSRQSEFRTLQREFAPTSGSARCQGPKARDHRDADPALYERAR